VIVVIAFVYVAPPGGSWFSIAPWSPSRLSEARRRTLHAPHALRNRIHEAVRESFIPTAEQGHTRGDSAARGGRARRVRRSAALASGDRPSELALPDLEEMSENVRARNTIGARCDRLAIDAHPAAIDQAPTL